MTPTIRIHHRAAWLVGLGAACLATSLVAQEAPSPPSAPPSVSTGAAELRSPRAPASRPAGEPEAVERRLPPDAVTRHAIELPGRTLRFVATAGSIRLTDAQGAPQADIATIDYRLEAGPEARRRAVTFVLNGGPGAASAWLHLGALGPWRLSMAGDAALPSASPELLPNAETWLDFTDLVFIDPVGTGYSGFV
jgi:carboxypeptidase C (cathepsin A)